VAEPKPIPAHHHPPIPPAIKRQAERAEQLQRESIGLPASDVAPGATSDSEQGSTEAVQPSPASEAPPAQPMAQTPPAAAAAPPSPPPVPSEAQQLAATQGRLDAERERSQQQAGEIASLRRMVDELQRQTRAPPPEAPPSGRRVTPEQEADYGEELSAYIDARADDIAEARVKKLEDKIASLEGQLGQVGSSVAKRDDNDVFMELQQAVPNWLTLNSDRDFIGWLQQPEPWSGLKRHDLLSRAFDSHDAPRVIRFFQGYLAEAAATGQAPVPTGSVPAPGAANGKVPLETFAAPGRAAPAPASAPPGSKPTYTRAQISQFFTEKAAGRWRGREAEAASLEADIFRAGPEGRVIG